MSPRAGLSVQMMWQQVSTLPVSIPLTSAAAEGADNSARSAPLADMPTCTAVRHLSCQSASRSSVADAVIASRSPAEPPSLVMTYTFDGPGWQPLISAYRTDNTASLQTPGMPLLASMHVLPAWQPCCLLPCADMHSSASGLPRPSEQAPLLKQVQACGPEARSCTVRWGCHGPGPSTMRKAKALGTVLQRALAGGLAQASGSPTHPQLSGKPLRHCRCQGTPSRE